MLQRPVNELYAAVVDAFQLIRDDTVKDEEGQDFVSGIKIKVKPGVVFHAQIAPEPGNGNKFFVSDSVAVTEPFVTGLSGVSFGSVKI